MLTLFSFLGSAHPDAFLPVGDPGKLPRDAGAALVQRLALHTVSATRLRSRYTVNRDSTPTSLLTFSEPLQGLISGPGAPLRTCTSYL